MSQGDAVIGEGHARKECLSRTCPHALFRGDAGPAVDDQVVGGEVFREVISCGNLNGEAASATAQQRRNLYPADVLGVRNVRAGFGDQHAGASMQPVDGGRPFDEGPDVSLGGCQQHGEGRQRRFRRQCGVNGLENRRVGDGQCGQSLERGQGVGQ